MRRRAIWANLAFSGLTLTSFLGAQAEGPWIGTWRLNLGKSTYSPGPPPAVGTVSIFRWVPEKDGFRYTLETTLPDGNKTQAGAFARFDGKEYPETGNPAADFNVFRRVDDHTYELADCKGGKDMLHFRITISKDGKTRTWIATGTNRSGQPVHNVGVWDRVQ